MLLNGAAQSSGYMAEWHHRLVSSMVRRSVGKMHAIASMHLGRIRELVAVAAHVQTSMDVRCADPHQPPLGFDFDGTWLHKPARAVDWDARTRASPYDTGRTLTIQDTGERTTRPGTTRNGRAFWQIQSRAASQWVVHAEISTMQTEGQSSGLLVIGTAADAMGSPNRVAFGVGVKRAGAGQHTAEIDRSDCSSLRGVRNPLKFLRRRPPATYNSSCMQDDGLRDAPSAGPHATPLSRTPRR